MIVPGWEAGRRRRSFGRGALKAWRRRTVKTAPPFCNEEAASYGRPAAKSGRPVIRPSLKAKDSFSGEGRRRHADAAHNGPITSCLNPYTSRRPPYGTSDTSRVEPGSNLTAVPGAMSRRMPRAKSRSKRRAGFVSKKW